MNSYTISYKFKAEKNFEKLDIEGTFISPFDCKKAIIEKKKLNCDLILLHPDTLEGKIVQKLSTKYPIKKKKKKEYNNKDLIKHSSSIIVKRIPLTENTRRLYFNKV